MNECARLTVRATRLDPPVRNEQAFEASRWFGGSWLWYGSNDDNTKALDAFSEPIHVFDLSTSYIAEC